MPSMDPRSGFASIARARPQAASARRRRALNRRSAGLHGDGARERVVGRTCEEARITAWAVGGFPTFIHSILLTRHT